MPERLLLDPWTPLSFKGAVADVQRGARAVTAPTWVGDHARRLRAYTLLRAYVDNAAREFLGEPDPDRAGQHREYGDAHLLVASATAAAIGESQTIYVDGAEDEMEAAAAATPAADGGDAAGPVTPAVDLQEWLRAWADRERFVMKMLETERNAVGLGDGVYTLGWNAKLRRPRLRVFDPGFYFPVLDDGAEDDYPETVHVAWEVDDPDDAARTLLRRITWRLGPLPEGAPPRRYPWADEGETSEVTCYLTDATWRLDRGGAVRLNDLDESEATFATDADGEVRDRDLMLDFLPVVHVPNTIAGAEHYGQSVLARVLQILDDLANADTDLQAASATTGKPPLALEGASLGEDRPTYRPGEIIETGDGRLVAVDTSRSLTALSGYVSDLLGRLSTNARLPASVLGRVEPSEVPSGIALLLSFGPLVAMVNEMRLVREEKYGLVLKFAHRIALAGRASDVPPAWLPAGVEFGPYLPEDRAAAVREVASLLEADAVSTETAVRLLVLSGLPIDDAQAEVRRIQSRDFAGANELLDATGSERAVFDYLGLDDLEPTRAAPPPALPVDEDAP